MYFGKHEYIFVDWCTVSIIPKINTQLLVMYCIICLIYLPFIWFTFQQAYFGKHEYIFVDLLTISIIAKMNAQLMVMHCIICLIYLPIYLPWLVFDTISFFTYTHWLYIYIYWIVLRDNKKVTLHLSCVYYICIVNGRYLSVTVLFIIMTSSCWRGPSVHTTHSLLHKYRNAAFYTSIT